MERNYSSLISREYLFNLVVENFDKIENHLVSDQFKQKVIGIFIDSAAVTHILEKEIDNDEAFSIVTFDELWRKLNDSLKNESFKVFFDETVRKVIHEKSQGRTRLTYKIIIITIFKEIALFQNDIIERCFSKTWFETSDLGNDRKPQTFLSYAYYDKGITLGLYLYFLINGGFLYVNWMWSNVNPAHITKKQLDNELANSNQFLFLRTLNSELDYYDTLHIRQWCSWEIGNYYTKNKSEKYYVNFYGHTSKNDLLSTFSAFNYVKNGVING